MITSGDVGIDQIKGVEPIFWSGKIIGIPSDVTPDYKKAVIKVPRIGLAGHGIRDVQILALQGKTFQALAVLREAIDEGFRGTVASNGCLCRSIRTWNRYAVNPSFSRWSASSMLRSRKFNSALPASSRAATRMSSGHSSKAADRH